MVWKTRVDYDVICSLVSENARVLDLGCGDGQLLELLAQKKGATGQGIEIDEQSISHCIARGLNVIHGNIDEGLADYADCSFDYVILNQTLQVIHKPYYVIKEMVRVGKKAIVGFPNFAYWRIRAQLFFLGVMPKTAELPYEWYNTPNIHLVTIRDFERFCEKEGIKIIDRIYIKGYRSKKQRFLANLLARIAIYTLSKDQK